MVSDAQRVQFSTDDSLGVRRLILENGRLRITVLPDKGADLYEWVHKGSGIDVLWKSPWGARRRVHVPFSTGDSTADWLQAYPGGWQMLFPNGGEACEYKGARLGFHGEASIVAWDWSLAEQTEQRITLELSTRLAASPFRIRRFVTLEAGRSTVTLSEEITNEGSQPMDYMWGHHPAFGEPLIGPGCRIDTSAKRVIADDVLDGPGNPMTPSEAYDFPIVNRDGVSSDLTSVPELGIQRQMLAYLTDFADQAWFAISNARLGIGVAMAWPKAAFPHAWFWQELNATRDFPWYGSARVLAIEPFTSYPGQGLVNVIKKTATHRTVAPGETMQATIHTTLFETATGVRNVSPVGEPEFFEQPAAS